MIPFCTTCLLYTSSVARTLYRQADLTILDDVSSALDYRTDLRLRSALRRNYKGKAVLLISQRISSVRGADQILVLEKGAAVGLGTHEELIRNCEAYRDICRTPVSYTHLDVYKRQTHRGRDPFGREGYTDYPLKGHFGLPAGKSGLCFSGL